MTSGVITTYLGQGTAAARPATPSIPSGGIAFYWATDTDALSVYAETVWNAIGGSSYTDEQAQDAIGAMVDTTLVYTDGTPLLSRAALTGDVTAPAGSNATTIANDAVTYAKMQNASAASRILGRKTSGSGDFEECTLSEILDFIGSAAQGDIIYRGAASWARLAAGTAGQALRTGGAGADPSWGGPGLVLLGTYSGSGANAVADFTSIPATYKDLFIVATGRTATAAFSDALNLTVNGLTTNIYDRQRSIANNASTTVSQSLAQASLGLGLNGSSAAANSPGVSVIEILDYAGTTFQKKVHCRISIDADGSNAMFTGVYDGGIRLTSAINQVTLTAGGNMATGTKIQLYGRG